jgi:Kdo2-lipid IVA lauroyltransferase/acyltransferase
MVAVRGLAGLAGHAPEAWARAGGAALGTLLYAVDARHRRVAMANLLQCFPTWTRAERARVARQAFRQLAMRSVELVRCHALPPHDLRARVEIEGAAGVRAAYAAGRGVLFFSGHFGCWELHAIVHAALFEPGGVLARRLDNPQVHTWVEGVRQRTGNVVIYRQGAVRNALRLLRERKGVAMLIDQHTHSPDAIWIRFFGRPAATTSTLATLALRTGAAVIPVFTIPLPGGRFRVIYDTPVELPTPDDPHAVHNFTQRCTDVLERYVRERPDLWLWMHQRWREPPAGAVPVGTR